MDARAVLDLWEAGVPHVGSRRDGALLRAAGTPRAATLTERNAALARLRAVLFGGAWPLRANCPACAGSAEFAIDALGLAEGLAPPAGADDAPHEAGGLRFRLPRPEDLDAAADLGDARAAEAELLRRCLLVDGADAVSSPEALAHVGERMAALEPGAAIGFDLACPHCGHGWSAAFDIGAALWAELHDAAERTLLDVDALARAYGWREADVLALSPRRRAGYLQLVGAA